MRYFQAFYALACTIWTVRLIQILVAVRSENPEATLSGAVYCVLMFAVLPAILGYLLLFKTFPWMSRLIRR